MATSPAPRRQQHRSSTPRGAVTGSRTASSGTTTADFAVLARLLSGIARRLGLVAPGFRCPPRLVGVDRSIRRREGGAVVSVRVKGRPWPAVVADMIEGVVAANELVAPTADRVRAELWASCQHLAREGDGRVA